MMATDILGCAGWHQGERVGAGHDASGWVLSMAEPEGCSRRSFGPDMLVTG